MVPTLTNLFEKCRKPSSVTPFECAIIPIMERGKRHEATYKRGQIEWAVWKYFTPGKKSEIPSKFRTRVKRLLELDRTTEFSDEKGMQYAFMAKKPVGKGTDYPYTAFDAFMLAIGLELLDSGYKQSEVVFLLRHMRASLFEEFRWILEVPDPVRQRIPAKHYPNRPKYAHNGNMWTDVRVFSVVRKVELTEVFPTLADSRRRNIPVIMEPAYCRGIDALREVMHEMGHQDLFRKAMVLELSLAAYAVSGSLPDAPSVKRGRV